MNITVITAILAIIEQAVALLGTGSNTKALIDSIIKGLEEFLPLIADFVPKLYQSIKGIIMALSADPSTLPDQLVALQALDAQVDAAFEAAAAAVDPDAVPPTT